MDIMERVLRKARENLQRVAFPEAENDKIQQAAAQCLAEGICTPILVGNPAGIQAAARANSVDLTGIEIMDAGDEALLARIIGAYAPTQDILSEKTLRRRCKDPMYVALIAQALGEVDVTFAGIDHTTADVIIAGKTIVGLQEGISTISSIGIANIPGYEGPEGPYIALGDSAVCVFPKAERLADIAISACETVSILTGWEPRCALLSYSTCGSGGDNEAVTRIQEAVRIANEKRPDLAIDGEFQLDSAISPAVAAKKVDRESKVAGRANIIIWPDLNAGNIGVKLIQQFGHADAYGPILQGFAKIVCDCSRGAPVSELVGNIAMSCVRAQGLKTS